MWQTTDVQVSGLPWELFTYPSHTYRKICGNSHRITTTSTDSTYPMNPEIFHTYTPYLASFRWTHVLRFFMTLYTLNAIGFLLSVVEDRLIHECGKLQVVSLLLNTDTTQMFNLNWYFWHNSSHVARCRWVVTILVGQSIFSVICVLWNTSLKEKHRRMYYSWKVSQRSQRKSSCHQLLYQQC